MAGSLALFRQFGTGEIVVILLVLLVLFGAKKLPEMGKGLGKGIREFRDATKGLADDVDEGLKGDDESRARRGSIESPPKNE